MRLVLSFLVLSLAFVLTPALSGPALAQDIAMPHSYPWHPRMSETLGLFRLVEV